ncbi:hypothetical protein BUALT_Bualt05G0054900 [Buddleja alternifolia]|uniref:F-box protein n=1 Tax=Buddleja alternifolia TaxID=168488 RepID=A0AAV6XIS8_9LAMI|nr:hypothetical protein BUALT_Bualt05G0054900 [Buddleja alternifolia]
MATSDQELSSDIIFEILTRTSLLQTLDNCKSVSEEWNNLIDDSSFLPIYCKRTNNLFGYFIQDMKHHKYSFMFVSFNDFNNGSSSSNVCMKSLPDDMRILASCNLGILCCVRRIGRYYRFYVGKPATGQWKCLPNPKLRYETAAIGIIVLRSSPLRYKIVRLSRHTVVECVTEYGKYRCEIFDSESWTWTQTQELKLPCTTDLISDSSIAVSASNSINWLTYEDNVLSYDKSKETFDKFSLPTHKNSFYKSKKLVEYNGRLGFTCTTEDGNMELWLRDNENSKNIDGWSRKMDLGMECVEKILKYPSPAGFCNGEIAFLKGVGEVAFYNFRNCSFNKVDLDYGLRDAHEVFHFRSDLEPVDLKAVRR